MTKNAVSRSHWVSWHHIPLLWHFNCTLRVTKETAIKDCYVVKWQHVQTHTHHALHFKRNGNGRKLLLFAILVSMLFKKSITISIIWRQGENNGLWHFTMPAFLVSSLKYINSQTHTADSFIIMAHGISFIGLLSLIQLPSVVTMICQWPVQVQHGPGNTEGYW